MKIYMTKHKHFTLKCLLTKWDKNQGHTFNWSLIFVSTSSRISAGSFSPAFENSTSILGNVAENRSVCLEIERKKDEKLEKFNKICSSDSVVRSKKGHTKGVFLHNSLRSMKHQYSH